MRIVLVFGGAQYAEIRRGDIGRRYGAAAASHGGAGVSGDEREHPSIALGTVYKHLNGLAGEALCPAYNALLENVSLCVYDRATDAAYLLKMDI